jgi:hypothetical protein
MNLRKTGGAFCMKILIPSVAGLLAVLGSAAPRADDKLVGTWKLVTATTVSASGERNDVPYGPRPVGLLTYTSDGRMTVIISSSSRGAATSHDGCLGSVDEEAFSSFLAYAGRYTFAGNRVIHHVEASSLREWIGKDLVRNLEFQDDRIKLTTPRMPVNGRTQTVELIWQRLAPRER